MNTFVSAAVPSEVVIAVFAVLNDTWPKASWHQSFKQENRCQLQTSPHNSLLRMLAPPLVPDGRGVIHSLLVACVLFCFAVGGGGMWVVSRPPSTPSAPAPWRASAMQRNGGSLGAKRWWIGRRLVNPL